MALRAEIFFGRMRANEHPAMAPVWIGDQQFNLFIRRKLTDFPGFTIVSAEGFWNGEREPASILILYGPNTEAFKREVGNIARAYADEFGQQSVLLAFDYVPAYSATKEAISEVFTENATG